MPLSQEAHRTFARLKKVKIDTDKIGDLEFDYIPSQYPEFEDACITYAVWMDTGKELTDEELDTLNEDTEFVYEALQDHIY